MIQVQVPQRWKPVIVAMIALSCLGGALAVLVPIGFLLWLDDQYRMATTSQDELMKKAQQVMVWDKLPDRVSLGAPTYSLTKKNLGSVLLEGADTSYYFEKKDATKLDAVKKRMSDKGGIADHFTVKETGELPVAGKTLHYVRGISERDNGLLYNEVHGYVMVDDNTLVEVATGTPDARPLDLNEFKSILGAIKSFVPAH